MKDKYVTWKSKIQTSKFVTATCLHISCNIQIHVTSKEFLVPVLAQKRRQK